MTACSVPDCGGQHYARGFCRKHYQRVRRDGDPGEAASRPGGGHRPKYTEAERVAAFWRHVQRTDTCWLWTGARQSDGYGHFRWRNGAMEGAHRIAHELTKGPIPEGFLVRHSCHNPVCVRPSHLSLGTYADNARDMVEAGRAWWQQSRVMLSLELLKQESIAA